MGEPQGPLLSIGSLPPRAPVPMTPELPPKRLDTGICGTDSGSHMGEGGGELGNCDILQDTMTRLIRVAAVLFAAVGSACSLHATMVPVDGPMSEQRPVPVLDVEVNGIMGNSGDLSFTIPGGEFCEGRWSSAAGTSVTVASSTLLTEYGPAYISGYSLSTDGGQNPGAALAVCDSGRSLQLDFVTGAGTAHGFGIGEDNEGNIYRFVF